MMDGDKEAGEKAGSYDKSYDDGDVLRVERGGVGAGGSSILRTLPDKTGKVFNLLYEFQVFITKLSVIFYEVSVKNLRHVS
jgi:hypothetical protein